MIIYILINIESSIYTYPTLCTKKYIKKGHWHSLFVVFGGGHKWERGSGGHLMSESALWIRSVKLINKLEKNNRMYLRLETHKHLVDVGDRSSSLWQYP